MPGAGAIPMWFKFRREDDTAAAAVVVAIVSAQKYPHIAMQLFEVSTITLEHSTDEGWEDSACHVSKYLCRMYMLPHIEPWCFARGVFCRANACVLVRKHDPAPTGVGC